MQLKLVRVRIRSLFNGFRSFNFTGSFTASMGIELRNSSLTVCRDMSCALYHQYVNAMRTKDGRVDDVLACFVFCVAALMWRRLFVELADCLRIIRARACKCKTSSAAFTWGRRRHVVLLHGCVLDRSLSPIAWKQHGVYLFRCALTLFRRAGHFYYAASGYNVY